MGDEEKNAVEETEAPETGEQAEEAPVDDTGDEGQPGEETPGDDEADEVQESAQAEEELVQIPKSQFDRLEKIEYWAKRETKRREREYLEQYKPETPTTEPKLDNYEDFTEYQKAWFEWRLASERAKEAEERQKSRLEEQKAEAIEFMRTEIQKKPGLAEKAFIPIAFIERPELSEVREVVFSDRFADFAEYFGENQNHAMNIAKMTPAQAAREITRLEYQLIDKKNIPPPKIKSNAPERTAAVGGKGGQSVNPSKMTTEEYRQWRLSGGGKDNTFLKA